MAWMTLSVDGLDGGGDDYFFFNKCPPFLHRKSRSRRRKKSGSPRRVRSGRRREPLSSTEWRRGLRRRARKSERTFFVETFTEAKRFRSSFPIFCPIDLNFSSCSTFVHIFFSFVHFCWPNCFLDLPNTTWYLMLDILDLLDLWKKFLPVFLNVI